MRLNKLVVLASTVLGLPCMASAQEQAQEQFLFGEGTSQEVMAAEGSFTPEQVTLNQMAALATKAGDFQRAEILFKANLELAPFDVTWLNLGRSYARGGKCVEARDSYQHVPNSTVLIDSGVNVAERLARFQAELNNECYEQFERIDRMGGKANGVYIEEQIALNQQAAEATLAGLYDRAELLFKANLELGEFDLTWLNLGRTYARAGKCIESREAYSHVMSAPILRESANMKLGTRLATFQEELQEQCATEFAEYDIWPKISHKYNVAGWTLLGVGLAGIAAGSVMFGLDLPASQSPTIEYFGGLDAITNQQYLEAVNSHRTKVLIAKTVPLAVGAAAAIAGAGVLIADHLLYGERKRMAKQLEESKAYEFIPKRQHEEVETTTTDDFETNNSATVVPVGSSVDNDGNVTPPPERTPEPVPVETVPTMEQDTTTTTQETASLGGLSWAPSIVIHPEFTGVGAFVRF